MSSSYDRDKLCCVRCVFDVTETRFSCACFVYTFPERRQLVRSTFSFCLTEFCTILFFILDASAKDKYTDTHHKNVVLRKSAKANSFFLFP